jgi:septal ring factor EnvC (AmiA/AmiB activator)
LLLAHRVIIGAALIWALTALASEEEEVEQELAQLRKALQSIETEWKASSAALSDEEAALARVDGLVASQVKSLRRAERKAQETKTQIDLLTGHKNELIEQRNAQLVDVQHHLRAAARMGATSPLKVMLNQEDPNSVARVTRYFGYFAEARMKRVNVLEQTLKDLAISEQQLAIETDELNDQLVIATKERDRLNSKRLEASAVVAQYRASYNSIDAQRMQLQESERDLLALLDSLRRQFFDFAKPSEVVPFASRKGNLPLPLDGRLVTGFGDLRPEGRVKWTGVLIEAPLGTPVKAIHYGRVVFADWLRGFGLLMIVSHDQGYMSLYGHNQVLLVEPGEWVHPGQIIGETGTSGGQLLPTTYFELRAAGQPIDPMLWCAASNLGRQKG